MINRPLLIAIMAIVVLSCRQSKPYGLVTTTQEMFDAQGFNGKVIEIIPTGAVVEPLGEVPKSLQTYVKVRYNNIEGFMLRRFMLTDGKPAMVKQGDLEGDFVVYDSLDGDSIHIYHEDLWKGQWIERKNLSFDSTDFVVAAVLDRLNNSDIREDDGKFTALHNAALKYPDHPRVRSIKINLEEIPDEKIDRIQYRDMLSVSKSTNTVVASTENAEYWVRNYLEDIFLESKDPNNPDGFMLDEVGFMITIPRARYFYSYLSALPEFVKMGARSSELAFPISLQAEEERAYFLYRLDRSPENISRLYSLFKPLIIEVFSSGRVKDIRPDVKDLIEAYDRIVATPNHKQLIKDVSRKVVEWDQARADKNGVVEEPVIVIKQGPIYEPLINTQKYNIKEDAQGIWYSSFWVRRFTEGNEKVVYSILKEIVEITPNENGEAESNETELITCTFNDYSVGDCGHMEFSCGDYGDADVSSLTEDEQQLWKSLSVSDGTGEHGNPEYIGKEFEIRIGTVRGLACNEGRGEGWVPRILAFKLKE
jgi:hypothetical protein